MSCLVLVRGGPQKRTGNSHVAATSMRRKFDYQSEDIGANNAGVSMEDEEASLLIDDEKEDATSTKRFQTFLTIVLPLLFGLGMGILVDHFIIAPSVVVPPLPSACLPPQNSPPTPKNVILMIGDGFGPAAATFTRVMLNRSLSMDPYLIGTVQTFASDTLVTDSAAAATSMACGIKTYNDAIGVNVAGKAVGTIMEAAAAAGMKTGFVVTSPVAHATPAGFSAHAVHRSLMDFIAYQQVNQSFDLMLGGGESNFLSNGNKALNLANAKGYNIVYNKTALATVELPALGLFASGDMTYMIDRTADSQEPTLTQMTARALELFAAQESGFFLMVEGSRVDHAEHMNDAAAMFGEAAEFDAAFQLVLDFARASGDTLVLLTADHETGGMSIGCDNIYAWYPEVLKGVSKSSLYIAYAIQAAPENETISIVELYTGITDLTTEEQEQLMAAPNLNSLQTVVANIISKRALIGWTTDKHTGVDVNLYGYGPAVNHFCANIDNTDIANRIQSLLGLDIQSITAKLVNFDPSGNFSRMTQMSSGPHWH